MIDEERARAERLRTKLLELQEAYVKGIPVRLADIGQTWDTYCSTQGAVALAQVLNEVHKLAGTATMYGLGDLGKYAYTAEEALLALEDEITAEMLEDADSALNRLLGYVPTG